MEPYLTAGNTLVYSHRAEIDPSQNLPELGSRGTARISGEKVRLGYYLFRRPFSRIRQFLGM